LIDLQAKLTADQIAQCRKAAKIPIDKKLEDLTTEEAGSLLFEYIENIMSDNQKG